MELIFIEKDQDNGYGLYCENDAYGISVFICLVRDNEHLNDGIEEVYPEQKNKKVTIDELKKKNKGFSFSFSGYVSIDIHNRSKIEHIENIFEETRSLDKRYTHNPKDIFDLIKRLPFMSNFVNYKFKINT